MKYEMLDINFDYTYIKDKKIDIDGNRFGGMIIISDEDDNIIQILGYELVEEEDKRE